MSLFINRQEGRPHVNEATEPVDNPVILGLAFIAMFFLWGEGTPYLIVAIPLVLMGTAIADSGQDVTATTQSQLQSSYASAANLAEQYPQYSAQVISAAQSSVLDGDQLAHLAGLVAVVIGGALTYFVFPNKEDEEKMRLAFHAEDEAESTDPAPTPHVVLIPDEVGAAAAAVVETTRSQS